MNQVNVVVKEASNLTQPQAVQLVRCLGYMAVMGAEFHVEDFLLPDPFGPKFDAVLIRATCPMRIPGYVGVTESGINIGTDAWVRMTVADRQASQELSNLERAIVNQGDFVAALLPPNVSVDSELLNSTRCQFPDGTSLVMGQASQSAQMGVYDTPFSTALAFINFGALTTIAGLVNNAAPLPPVQTPTVPVAGNATSRRAS